MNPRLDDQASARWSMLSDHIASSLVQRRAVMRTATALLEVDASSPATLILSLAIADAAGDEALTVAQLEDSLRPVEVLDEHGTRLHAPASIGY